MNPTALEVIHAPNPHLNEITREEAEDYLRSIATALDDGWHDQLDAIANERRYIREHSEEWQADNILDEFRAEESTSGIMKAAVFINHQWVVKLGWNAVMEAETYENANEDERQGYVPTVPLGDYGCLQLKVELPVNNRYTHTLEGDGWEKKYKELEDTCAFSDCHRGNVGIWRGELLALDFAGSEEKQ